MLALLFLFEFYYSIIHILARKIIWIKINIFIHCHLLFLDGQYISYLFDIIISLKILIGKYKMHALIPIYFVNQHQLYI